MAILIDLRSDTITRLTREDLDNIDVMRICDSGFDVDPYVAELEESCARLFGKESAIFLSSGTLSNQIALRCLAQVGEEVITGAGYHIDFFESSQIASCSGIVLNAVRTTDGILRLPDIEAAIDEKARWSSMYAEPRVVAVENSVNTYGGAIFPLDELTAIARFCRERGLYLYMDGARLLNSCAATGVQPDVYAAGCDLISLCFSKGLGAPFGSILVGDSRHITKARKYRKWYGGAMHQAGLMAAIALRRLPHWKLRLTEDNDNARRLSEWLDPSWNQPYRTQTNMVFLRTRDASRLVRELVLAGVLAVAWTKDLVRFVTSSVVDEIAIRTAASIINRFAPLAMDADVRGARVSAGGIP
jgi:threonine aldolase